MYELVKVSDRCYYIECPSRIGIYKITDSAVALIDSGNSKEMGKKIRKILDTNGWELRAIYNTHSHGDHTGANNYLQKLTGCKVYARGIECDFTNHTILGPAHLYGALPPKDIVRGFLYAEPCICENITDDVMPEGLEFVDLSGHSFDMVGFRSSDGVYYLGDSVLNKEVLEKYGITFLHDVDAHVKTLTMLKEAEGKMFIPSHAVPCENICELADFNLRKVLEVRDKILDLCAHPISFESLLKKLFDEYSKQLNFDQYALIGSTVRSYLASLKNEGLVEVSFDENIMRWHRF